jgi:EAL domain-containing protein (putative c-di-GMP-specific phosphodiesterase class I)
LKGLPVDDLKIDQSFVRNLGTDVVDTAICTAILSLARSIGLKVVAEGVESQMQLDWLREHGCDEAQGFLIARPMRGRDVLARYGGNGGAARIAVAVA